VRIRRPLLAWGGDPETTLSQLSLYADEEAVEAFRRVQYEGRRAFLDSLWKELDPTPSTRRNELMDEFVRRLRYAEDRWRIGPLHGWDIDIGRIYIAYGEPDEVVDERSSRAARTPLDRDRQIAVRKWIYHEPPVTFVFEYEPGRGWILNREVSSPLPPGHESVGLTDEVFERSQ